MSHITSKYSRIKSQKVTQKAISIEYLYLQLSKASAVKSSSTTDIDDTNVDAHST